MKIVAIGCTHAGTAAISNMAKLYPDAQITVYERNDNISFLSCGIALYVEGVVKDINGLFYSSPSQLASMGVDTKMKHEVLSVDIKAKKLTVKSLESGEQFEDTYDKLLITSGSWPIMPKFPGGELENIVLCKNFDHAKEIIKRVPNAKNVTVIGAGYIGVELVVAFKEQGKEVTLIDVEDRIMKKYMDKEFTDLAEKQLTNHGIKLALGEKVMEFVGENGNVAKVVTDKNTYEADLVVQCIGFRPNTDLFKGQLEMLPNGAIVVDEYMHTSDADVVAAGDCCTVHYNPTNETRYIPLATNAVRMGIVAAKNLVEKKVKHVGTQGTSGIKVYNENLSATGLTEDEAKRVFGENNVKSIVVKDNYTPEFMPNPVPVTLKLVFEGESRRLVGAQLTSEADYTQVMNTLSVCVYKQMTIEEVALVDQFFQPYYNKPWNLINTAALGLL